MSGQVARLHGAGMKANCPHLILVVPVRSGLTECSSNTFGIPRSVERIRQWCGKFGVGFARKLRLRRLKQGRTWHLNGVYQRIIRVLRYLWRAVDQRGV